MQFDIPKLPQAGTQDFVRPFAELMSTFFEALAKEQGMTLDNFLDYVSVMGIVKFNDHVPDGSKADDSEEAMGFFSWSSPEAAHEIMAQGLHMIDLAVSGENPSFAEKPLPLRYSSIAARVCQMAMHTQHGKLEIHEIE